MDRRQRKTRAAVFAAFESLLARKQYHKITIREIIDAADVGRTTFYEHFETKDALLDALCSDLFQHIFSPEGGEPFHSFPSSSADPRLIVTHILYHIREDGSSMKELICGESSELFLGCFRRKMGELVLPMLLEGMEQTNQKVSPEFLRSHICASFLNLIQWWIQRGMPESPETLCDYFFAVIDPIL